MEWDIAAGHALVNIAGGRVTSLDGAELEYGKPGFENPHFVASGRRGDDAGRRKLVTRCRELVRPFEGGKCPHAAMICSRDPAISRWKARAIDSGVIASSCPTGSAWRSKSAKLPIEFFPGIGEGFQHAANRVTVTALEMQRIGEIDKRFGHQGLVVEHAFERRA
jgi:hypothetical protein